MTSHSCQKMGLQLNAKKTEVMTFNINEKAKITTKNGTILAVKEDFKYLGSYISSDFKYLGSYISSTEKDIRVQNSNLHGLGGIHPAIWFRGMDAYCCARSSARWLTCMLRIVFNVTWRDRVRNEVLYGNLLRITTKIRKRRLRKAGHCVRHPELAASKLVLWEPTQGQASRGGQSFTFIEQLLRDTSLKTAADVRTCMEDRDVWRVIVARGDSTRCY